MDTLDKLRKDKQLYQAYKDNIAMAFKDNINWYKKRNRQENIK